MPLPEPVAVDLEMIDAALAGDRVDPEFADLAELALLLRAGRPRIPEEAAARLDVRVSALAGDARPARVRSARPWFLRPAFGVGLAVAAILAVLVIVLPRGGGGGTSAASISMTNSGASRKAMPGTLGSLAPANSLNGTAGGSEYTPPLAPAPASGQKIVQSSQLQLTAPGDRINQVSQELFDVVGAEQGLVKRSTVTAGSGGYASFTLSIPTANLSATLSRLASLKHSRVTSSTESTTDVTDAYQDDQRRLADTKALHTSLLKRLAAATTTAAVTSLDQQIKDAEASISAAESTLNGLQGQISYTTVSVQINPGSIAVGAHVDPSGSFTLGRAGHDALRVLAVAAGVLLIALAVLVPLGLVVGAGLWLAAWGRRRRRESALDAA